MLRSQVKAHLLDIAIWERISALLLDPRLIAYELGTLP